MKVLLEITILAALNLFLFGYAKRKLILLVTVQHQQLAVYKRTVKRPKIKERDRIFWVLLSKIWAEWKDNLIIVKPDTVIRWQRRRQGKDHCSSQSHATGTCMILEVETKEGN